MTLLSAATTSSSLLANAGTPSAYASRRIQSIQVNVQVPRENAAEMTEEGHVREQRAVQQLDPRHVGGRKRDTGPTLRREEEIAQGGRSRVIVVGNDLVSEEHAAETHRAVVVGRGIEPGPIQRPCH